jgi:hypothetical protein
VAVTGSCAARRHDDGGSSRQLDLLLLLSRLFWTEVEAYPAGEAGHDFVRAGVDFPMVGVDVGVGLHMEGHQLPAVPLGSNTCCSACAWPPW